MASQGWSSLPADLVNRIAGCLLATNELDYYTDLRAVCQHWRSSTADPRSNQHDPRFRPCRWVLLDERKLLSSGSDDDGTLLFVNTATGRFLSMSLLRPFLRRHRYDFVAATTGGLLVLAARDSTPKHAALVLNPFTGSMTHFAARVPPDVQRLTAEVVGPSPTLVMAKASVASSDVYWADPSSEIFSVEHHDNCSASRLPLIAAAKCTAAVRRDPDREGNQILDKLLSSEECRCYVVSMPFATGGDMLAVFNGCGMFGFLKLDAAGNVMETVISIGSLALFLGVRCLAVDAGCFPTIEPNCIYFQAAESFPFFIYKVDIIGTSEEQEPQFVGDAADYYDMPFVHDDGSVVDFGASSCCRPFTVTQILFNYTASVPRRPGRIDSIKCSDEYSTDED